MSLVEASGNPPAYTIDVMRKATPPPPPPPDEDVDEAEPTSLMRLVISKVRTHSGSRRRERREEDMMGPGGKSQVDVDTIRAGVEAPPPTNGAEGRKKITGGRPLSAPPLRQ